jgi:hypothetical protein
MATSLYFAPTYFSPYFFAPLDAPLAVPPVTVAMPYGDRDAFKAILSLLKGTGAFERVFFANTLDRNALSPATAPTALLVPGGWEEFDEVDPVAILRRVEFSLSLLVRGDDPFGRFDELGQLEAVVQNAIAGSDLGGCLPGLTRIRRGRYDQRSLQPEQILTLDGEFTYMIVPNSPAT